MVLRRVDDPRLRRRRVAGAARPARASGLDRLYRRALELDVCRDLVGQRASRVVPLAGGRRLPRLLSARLPRDRGVGSHPRAVDRRDAVARRADGLARCGDARRRGARRGRSPFDGGLDFHGRHEPGLSPRGSPPALRRVRGLLAHPLETRTALAPARTGRARHGHSPMRSTSSRAPPTRTWRDRGSTSSGRRRCS